MDGDDLREKDARLRVTVVSPLPAVRAGLRAMLSEDPTLEVTAQAALDWQASVAGEAVTVVDLQEGGDEIGVVEEALGATPALFLGATSEDFAGVRQALAGRAYLLNDATAEELQAAVHAVAAGLVVFSAGAVPIAGSAPVRGSQEGLSPLTERELQVLRLMGDGLPNKTIAMRLGITEHTVKFHVGAILGKLGAGSRTEAVTIAVRSGVLPL